MPVQLSGSLARTSAVFPPATTSARGLPEASVTDDSVGVPALAGHPVEVLPDRASIIDEIGDVQFLTPHTGPGRQPAPDP